MKWYRIGSNGAQCLAENDVGVKFFYYLVRHSFTFIDACSSVFRTCIIQNGKKPKLFSINSPTPSNQGNMSSFLVDFY